MSTLHKKRKRKKDKDSDSGDSGSSQPKRKKTSSSSDSDKADKKVKPIPHRENASASDIKKDVGDIDKNIDKAKWTMPADAGPFAKAAFILKKALFDMAKKRGDIKDDAQEDDKKDGSDKDKDAPANKSDNKPVEGRTADGKDIKKLMDDYNQKAAALAEKMEKMPKVAQLPTDPAKLEQADIDAGIDDINTDINKARYIPPGVAGVFLKIAYILREALLRMAGGGTEAGESYGKLLNDYKEAYSKIKDAMANAPDDSASDDDGKMTKEEIQEELGDIKDRFAGIANLPGTEAQELLNNTIGELQQMVVK